jgi:hypothetical protein
MSITTELSTEIPRRVDQTYRQYMFQHGIINQQGQFIKNFSEDSYRQTAVKVLTEFYDIMSEKVTLFPMFGTLLGIVRGNDLIPHDCDIDFGYFLNQQQELLSALDELHGKEGFQVIRNQFNDLFSVGKDGVLIDLYRYDDHGVGDFLSQGSRKPYNLLTMEIYPMGEIEFAGKKMTCIANPVAFFERYYGADWETPK